MTEEKTGFPALRLKRPDELLVGLINTSPYILIVWWFRDDKSTRYQRAQRSDDIDKKYGFSRYTDSVERMGWLINMHPVSSKGK